MQKVSILRRFLFKLSLKRNILISTIHAVRPNKVPLYVVFALASRVCSHACVCVFAGRVVCHCLWQFPEFAVRRLHCSRSLSPPKYSKNKNKSKNNKGTTNNNYNNTGAAKACGTKWNGMKDWNRRRYFFRFFLFFIRFGFSAYFICLRLKMGRGVGEGW